MTTGQWWLPAAQITTRTIHAHLLPPGATGSRGAALCGEGRSRWVPVGTDAVRHYCHACQVRGGRRPVGTAAVGESRQAALAAAGWCLHHGHGPEVLADLLDALLEHPGQARRAS